MDNQQPPFQLRLTQEQQELIHRITGEHASMLELTPGPSDASSGEGCGLRFGWRLSVDSGIPRQQWILNRKPEQSGPAPEKAESEK